MRGLNRFCVICAIMFAALIIVSTGCTNSDASEDSEVASEAESVEESVGDESASDSDAAAADVDVDADIDDDDAGDDADDDDDDTDDADDDAATDAVQAPVLGPTDAAVSWAYLTDMYQANGYWYVVVDYIQVSGPEEDLQFVNQNPMLRTFPLASNAELLLLKSMGAPEYDSVSPADFDLFQEQAGDELVEVTPQGGYAVGLKQWWSP